MIYNISKSFTTRTKRSERVLQVAEAFGLGLEEKSFSIFNNLDIEVNPGDVVFITGQSGSGKSQLLLELTRQMRLAGMDVRNIDEVELQDEALIDQLGNTMEEANSLLSRAGINDAYLLLRSPKELSDGQRYRLRIAKLFETNADVWVADEFGAVLDRVTAKTVAYNAQKLARQRGKILIVATTHDDLVAELGPSLTITKHFQERVMITRAESYKE